MPWSAHHVSGGVSLAFSVIVPAFFDLQLTKLK